MLSTPLKIKLGSLREKWGSKSSQNGRTKKIVHLYVSIVQAKSPANPNCILPYTQPACRQQQQEASSALARRLWPIKETY
jgi:hypothetical protein